MKMNLNVDYLKKMKKKVQFDDNVRIYFIPFEERKGIWMQYALDRAHFKRKIEKANILLTPLFRQRLIEYEMSKVSVIQTQNC